MADSNPLVNVSRNFPVPVKRLTSVKQNSCTEPDIDYEDGEQQRKSNDKVTDQSNDIRKGSSVSVTSENKYSIAGSFVESQPAELELLDNLLTQAIADLKFHTIDECQYLLPVFNLKFKARRHQFFLVKIPIELNTRDGPKPFPSSEQAIDNWNNSHVKMPNSPNYTETVQKSLLGVNFDKVVTKWEIIEKAISQKLTNFKELDTCIRTYNHYDGYYFDVLRQFLEPTPMIATVYPLLNFMAKLALKLPKLLTQSVPLLRQRKTCLLFLSQKQIACLMANAFFCTFPRRSKENTEYKNFPIFNFINLFASNGDKIDLNLKIEKLKCIFNYFERVQQERPQGIVSFERRFLSKVPEWHESDKLFKNLKIETTGSVEETGRQYSEVVFASKLIGGGVLNSGALQEEIRFLISPELIVSRLFTEVLLDEEALIINGTVRYNQHKGFGHAFQWVSSVGDSLQLDDWNRHCTQVIAIDATDFQTYTVTQFGKTKIDRELNKAFCGFKDDYKYRANNRPTIASGKWSNTGFHGDPFLNCLLQYLAASEAERDLILFIKNDRDLEEKLNKLSDLAINKSLNIGQVYSKILEFTKETDNFRKNSTVIDYICDHYNKSNKNDK